MDRFVSVRQVAHKFGCSESCVWKWVARGGLPSIKVGILHRIRERDDIEAWLRLGMVGSSNVEKE
jgi:excisionase family DNA binding protein